MNDWQQPGSPWREQSPAKVIARERGRARLRAVTLAAGAASVAAAGVVAFTLPGPKHTAQTSSGRQAAQTSTGQNGSLSSPAGSSSGTASGESGDDDGSRAHSSQPSP
ncbi:MAG: hypothetical protein LBI49_11035, partial [Nocardiopsaceae bacterium]|nr:hypothetical protein [Nocardiopsaceae bacterium]